MASAATRALLDLLGIELPILQAPMAGVSTPAMAAAVSGAGALGGIAVGATDAAEAGRTVDAVRAATNRPLNVNVFCHRPAVADPAREQAWIERFAPTFAAYGVSPPDGLAEIYRSFVEDEEMLSMLLAKRPAVVSVHFGLPPEPAVRALREAGIVLIASATSLAEARVAVTAGVHAIVAQGWEAGGHRGVFDPDAPDEALGTLALTRLLARELPVPVIAAGGIMDGAGVAAALMLGAGAAQLGTAFVLADESQADTGYRATLQSEAAHHTTMTRVVSGRPARSLATRFTALGADIHHSALPAYPIAYDLGKRLHASAKATGETGFGAYWAGQGAPLARALPAAEIVRRLAAESEAALGR